jgi:hypothetical protein
MSWIMPEIVVQRVLTHGLQELRKNKEEFYDLFAQFLQDELAVDYGPKYLHEIHEWFLTTKIPVVQAWSLNIQRIPCLSVHLANETEDESKAAVGDIFGSGRDSDIGIGVFTVMVDIGVHANKAGDHVLWLYYITSYILFKHKLMAERLGLRLHTFSASDYNKDQSKMTDNVWTRWVRFKCTTQNHWNADKYLDIDEVNTYPAVELPHAKQVAVSRDVDIRDVQTTFNKGMVPESASVEEPQLPDDDDDGDMGL